MSDTISSTHQYLLQHYGPLLTLKHLAEVLHSTPNGLRMAMSRQREPFTAALAETKRRVGRRIYFEARRVAELIDQDQEGSSQREPRFDKEKDYGAQERPKIASRKRAES